MTHDFDKAVPIPTAVERIGVNIELLRAMQPGDSKWWPEDEAKKAARFYRVAKKLGIPIIIRKVAGTDPRGPGVRMWRQEGGPATVVDPLAQAAAAATRAAKPKARGKVAKKAVKAPAVDLQPAKTKAKPKGNSAKAAPKRRKLIPGIPSTPAALKRAAEQQ